MLQKLFSYLHKLVNWFKLQNFTKIIINKFYKIEQERFPAQHKSRYGKCSHIVKKLSKRLKGKLKLFYSGTAVFVPTYVLDQFEMELRSQGVALEHIWGYDLKIDAAIQKMKLIWIVGYKNLELTVNKEVKRAFSFLQPEYLRYIDKPFYNQDAITQVNLILDHYRTQRRRKSNEIFNVFDLVAFKMAIDDNRLEYENCEFHKLIDRALSDDIKSGTYMNKDDGLFKLHTYLGSKHEFRKDNEMFDYLIYHFQETIGSIRWKPYESHYKISNITNVSAFLESYSIHNPTLVITETDSNGKCAEVLFEILSKSTKKTEFRFDLDGQWIYSGDPEVNVLTESLAKCKIRIITKNSFYFIENFINWIKCVFGPRAADFISLRIEKFETISSYIFNEFYIKQIQIWSVTLDYKLIQMLKKCKHKNILFDGCRLQDDINERYDLMGCHATCDQNIFKLIDELHNLKYFEFVMEQHAIGTLFAYIASVMMENNLMEFQFNNSIRWYWPKQEDPLKFKRSGVNTSSEQIEAYTMSGDKIDFYEYFNDLQPSDPEEFDFYQ